MKPLSYPAKRLLSHVEANPGLSRSKLASQLYPTQNPYYSIPRVICIVKTLESRGLVEVDEQAEGERFGVKGVWMKGQERPSKPGYLGIFGRVV